MSSSTTIDITPSSPTANTNTNDGDVITSSTTTTTTTPTFNGDLKINEKAAREFSQNIGKVVNLAHLVPAVSGLCQKFQLEQAAAAVCFERLSPCAEKEKAREVHFIEGIKRGFDFCLATAKAALNEALIRGVPTNNSDEKRESSVRSNSSSASNENEKEKQQQQQLQSPNSVMESSTNSSNFPMVQGMATYNSCEDITSAAAAHGNSNANNNNNNNSKNSNQNTINEHVIQCIAELSYYSVEVLQQTFLISGNPKICAHLRDYAVSKNNINSMNNHQSESAVPSSENNANNTNLNTVMTPNNGDKLTEYIRAAFSASREIELAWFAEGFRTMHMNLLCNVLYDSVAACRAVLNCEGLVMLILFHGKHLDPENPGLNEWSAFAMRTLTGVAPEAAAMINEMKRKAQEMSTEKRKEQEETERKMRDEMRAHEQEFM